MTTTFLYHGGITATLPGWLSSAPLDVFYAVHDRATEVAHPLKPLMDIVGHFFHLGQRQGLEQMKAMEPLRDAGRAHFIHMVYPGTTESYEIWKPYHEACLPAIAASLKNPVDMCTASNEFLWRMGEYALEIGTPVDSVKSVDADRVLQYFLERATALGGDLNLLCECGLNRYFAARHSPDTVDLATDSPYALLVLSGIDPGMATEIEGRNSSCESLSFSLFDRLVSGYTRPLHPDYVVTANELIDKRKDAIDGLKKKCESAAMEILSMSNSNPEIMERAIYSSFEEMELEAREIAQIDSSSFKSYIKSLAQDSKVWMSVVGLVATDLPTVLSVSTALAVTGAAALKAADDRASKLSQSPYRFLYYASKLT